MRWQGGDDQACKGSVTRAYDELNAERDRVLLAHGAAVELSMRSYPATSEDDWKREFAARIDAYWQLRYPGVSVEDRIAGPTPGADASYAFRELRGQALASSLTAISSIAEQGISSWYMDMVAADAAKMRDGVAAQFDLISGLVTSKYPSIDIQAMVDQGAVLTEVEKAQAYLALIARSGNKFSNVLRVKGVATADRVVIDEGRIDHMFRDDRGHLPDTPANRELLLRVANDPAAINGVDKFGVRWSSSTQSEGTQVWVRVSKGVVVNGGVNKNPLPYHQDYGFASPVKPVQKKVTK